VKQVIIQGVIQQTFNHATRCSRQLLHVCWNLVISLRVGNLTKLKAQPTLSGISSHYCSSGLIIITVILYSRNDLQLQYLLCQIAAGVYCVTRVSVLLNCYCIQWLVAYCVCATLAVPVFVAYIWC